jgi:hypothetical protein
MPMLRCLSTGCGGISWIQNNNVVRNSETELNKESIVQECDATMINSSNTAKDIK